MAENSIIIVDYGLGNLRSLQNAFKKIGANVTISADLEALKNADGLVIPGVGAFGKAMEKIKAQNLFQSMKAFLNSGKPVLGICLGMQLLFEGSKESPDVGGFSHFLGQVKKVDIGDGKTARLPHIGWTTPNRHKESDLFFDTSILSHLINQKQYFVHSFAAEPTEKKDILLTAHYAEKDFVCAVQKKNVIGVQFHPEKSREPGLMVLKNFVNLC